MKKEVYKQILNNAVKEYTDDKTATLSQIAAKHNVNSNQLSKAVKNSGGVVRYVNGKKSAFKSALNEYDGQNADYIYEKYGILKYILDAAKTKSYSELKQLCIDSATDEYDKTPDCEKNVSEVAKKYGLNKKTVIKYLRQKNIRIVNKNTVVTYNEHAFDDINTEEKAYWLGFMYADGFISSKDFAVGLSLSLKDFDHLKKYNSFLNYTKGLTVSQSHQFGSKSNLNSKGEEMYTVSTVIRNENLWRGLNKQGCAPNKSLILKFPKESIFSDKKLIYAFIRGYFDGDGTLGMYKHSKQNPKLEASLMFVGTKDMLTNIEKYLGKGFLMQKPNCNSSVYRLSYSTKKAINAAKLMYDGATVYLNRKFKIYSNKFAPVKSDNIGER